MKSKCVSEDLLKSSELINPFVHHLELTTTYEKLKTGILTVMVLPIRVAIIIGLLVTAWLLAVAGMIGLSQEDLLSKPLVGWRMKVKKMIAKLMCLTYQAGGIRLVVKGRQATRSEAPILVIAPHSTFLDAVIVYVTGSPTIIVRKESGNNPWLGKILNYTQPIFVTRDDPDSRHITVQQIINRVHSKEDWSQVLIFPEATCTNRSCLITFKPGAFYPGLPVQPVLIRYPNKIDTVTWTWEGPGPLKLMWMTLVQPQSICEIEFLPVYRPSEEERKNPKLFASNVRSLMAKSLGVPTMDYTYDDCKLVSKAKKLSFSKQSPLLQAHQLRVTLGLSRNQVEEKLVARNPALIKGPEKLVDLAAFSTTLGLNPTDPLTKSLFMLYEKDDSGLLDFKEYLLSVVLVNKSQNRLDMVQQAFQLCEGGLSKYDLSLILGLVLQMDADEVESVFRKVSGKTRRRVSYDDFEEYAKARPEFSSIFGKSPRRLSLPKDEEHKTK